MVSEATSNKLDHAIELGYVVGSALFIYGTLLSFPGIKWVDPEAWGGLEQEEVANIVNDIGSIMFFVLALYDVIDKFFKRKAREEHVTRKEIIEQCLYVFGSLIFALGTNFYDENVKSWWKSVGPKQLTEIDYSFWGSVLFMSGSGMFGFAVYVDALDMKHTHLSFLNHGLMISIYNELGSFMFLCGTVPYLPGFAESEKFGFAFARWNYLIGSCLFTYSAFLGMLRSISLELRAKMVAPPPDAKDIQSKCILDMLASHGIWLQPGPKADLDAILSKPAPAFSEPNICGLFYAGCTGKVSDNLKPLEEPILPKTKYTSS